jgi:endo-1,4-beta-mannosidase
MKKTLKRMIFGLFFFFLILFIFLFIGKAPLAEEFVFGVNFSQKHTTALGLDWKEVYLSLLDDLKVKNIKLVVHWNLIEPEKDQFSFEDLDWQIEKAKEKEVKILLVLGMKTSRWPECHIPEWAKGKVKEEQQEEILKMLETVVLRYKESPEIEYWQIENEPLFPFGECPWKDKEFIKKEISLVKSLDQSREIVISDSGEGSLWFVAAQLGDIVGTTLYRKVWFKEIRLYISYPFPPVFYWRKNQVVEKLFGKEVICTELQAEPWGPTLLYNLPLKEQEKSMNLLQFKENIEFAKKTGLKKFYLWGAEWWYWMKEVQQRPEIWQEAKKLF